MPDLGGQPLTGQVLRRRQVQNRESTPIAGLKDRAHVPRSCDGETHRKNSLTTLYTLKCTRRAAQAGGRWRRARAVQQARRLVIAACWILQSVHPLPKHSKGSSKVRFVKGEWGRNRALRLDGITAQGQVRLLFLLLDCLHVALEGIHTRTQAMSGCNPMTETDHGTHREKQDEPTFGAT